MRLLKLNSDNSFSLETFSEANIPPYAILSHTWGREQEEVVFGDLRDGTGSEKEGYKKLQFCAIRAKEDDLPTSGSTHAVLTNQTTASLQGQSIRCSDGIKMRQDVTSIWQT